MDHFHCTGENGSNATHNWKLKGAQGAQHELPKECMKQQYLASLFVFPLFHDIMLLVLTH